MLGRPEGLGRPVPRSALVPVVPAVAPLELRFLRSSIHATTALAAASGETMSKPHEAASGPPPAVATRTASADDAPSSVPLAAGAPDGTGGRRPDGSALSAAPSGLPGAKSGVAPVTPGPTDSSFVTTIRNPVSALRPPGEARHRAALRPRFGSLSHDAPRTTRRSGSVPPPVVTSGSVTAPS
jgi:hypothetical protein